MPACRLLLSWALAGLEEGAAEPCGSGGGHTCLSEPLRVGGCRGGRLRLHSAGSERGGIEQTLSGRGVRACVCVCVGQVAFQPE